MAYYDSKPSPFEAVGNGSLRYRFNIEEEQPEVVEAAEDGQEDQNEPHTQWKCDEVVIWPPFTANHVLEAVIAESTPASRETKLINDFNAAKLGLLGGSTSSTEAKEKIAAYKDFLNTRADLKAQVDKDSAEYGLQ